MICPGCGRHNDSTAMQCMYCGKPLRQNPYGVSPVKESRLPSAPPSPRPPNHLVKAILATLFCCLPLGIVAIVYAAQVNAKYESGNYQGALESSRQADTWGNISIILGLVPMALYAIAILAGGAI